MNIPNGSVGALRAYRYLRFAAYNFVVRVKNAILACFWRLKLCSGRNLLYNISDTSSPYAGPTICSKASCSR